MVILLDSLVDRKDAVGLCKEKAVWEGSLAFPGQSLYESMIDELSEYFSKKEEETRYLMDNAKELFADEWSRSGINVEDESSLIEFYNSTDMEIFELSQWHMLRSDNVPLNYLKVLCAGRELDFRKYLDFG